MLPKIVCYEYNSNLYRWRDYTGQRDPVTKWVTYFVGTCQETGETLHAHAGSGHYAGSPYLPVSEPFYYSITDDGEVFCEDEYDQEVSTCGWESGEPPLPCGFNIVKMEKNYYDDSPFEVVGEVINPARFQ